MDATTEEALTAAGIMRTRGLVTALGSDANNVFITLTAKGLRPDIFVLAKASEENNEEKLLKGETQGCRILSSSAFNSTVAIPEVVSDTA